MAHKVTPIWLTVDIEQQLKSGDADALIQGVAAKVASLFRCAGAAPNWASGMLDVFALAGTSKQGMLAAAIVMRDLLAQSPKGRQALLDFGFEPVQGAQE